MESNVFAEHQVSDISLAECQAACNSFEADGSHLTNAGDVIAVGATCTGIRYMTSTVGENGSGGGQSAEWGEEWGGGWERRLGRRG